jgi:hypothetical protein
MNDWIGFLIIWVSSIAIIGILMFINSETLWIIFAVVVFIGTIWLCFSGSGGRGDGGMDGGNY